MDDILFYLKILLIFSIIRGSLSLVINTKDGSMYRSDKLNFQQFTVAIRHIPKSSSEIHLNNSAVILTQDLEDLNEFNVRAVLSNEFPQKLRFIGVYRRSKPRDGQKFKPVDALQGHITQYEYLMEVDTAKINLITFEFFSKETCGFSIPIINNFDKASLEWKKEHKYKEKYMNFNNCDLKIEVRHMGSHLAYYSNNELKGFIKDVGDALGHAGNFKPLYIDIKDPKNRHLAKAGFDATKINVKLATGFHSKFHRKYGHITKTFDQVEQNFALTKSEAYNSYEKLILPFDATTWYLVIITFSLAFVVIFLARFLPQLVRDYIFGEGIDTPAFNVVGTFFGIGQIRLPDGNFPRFILMMFILFCLIIRTAYQGVQFDMLTKDMRKPLPKTLHDLCMRNYTIVVENWQNAMNYTFVDQLLTSLSERPNIIIVENSLEYFEAQIENSSAKLAFPITSYFAKSRYFSNQTFIILEETFFTAQEGFVLFKNNFMFHLTDRVIQWLIPTGIIQRLKDYHIEIKESKEDPEDEGPSVFSVPDLSFGFVLWLVACGASLSVFVVEWLIPRVKHFIRTTFALVFLLKFIIWRMNRIVVD